MTTADGDPPLEAAFADPPVEYGPVPLWWWDGEELDPERMTAQLEALADGGVPSVCFISKYPHGPAGDEQRYFSEAWWDRLEHVAAECERLGMELWVHDETYHHSPPDWREYWQDAIRAETGERPGLRGRVLDRVAADVAAGEAVALDVPGEMTPLSVAAYPREDDTGGLVLDDAVALDVEDERVSWTAPAGATAHDEWHVAAVGHRPEGLCYTSPDAAERYLDLHFEEYVRRLGDRVGDVLVGTFEDELVVLDGEVPCDGRVLERFREAHGYDPVERLIGLYEPTATGPGIRTDYYDVVTALLEECWFEPLYEWHETHDLARAHDNWGRNDLAAGTEQYGDYYRTMRWYQAPGYDDGGPSAIGDRNFFDAKLAASIAACYDRDRVWGELFHSTGWGFAPDDQLAGVVENVCYGCTLYDAHGLYYTTLGGWWEHAPGDVHFRQPYWGHVDDLNDAATRLSLLFGRGEPVVDAALLYPTASLHADWHPDEGIGERGREIDAATRETAAALYDGGTDLVLADPASVADATVEDGTLSLSGTGAGVPALVLPPTTTVERSTLSAARDLYDAGGVVAAVGRLPTATVDPDDPGPAATLEHLFGPDAPTDGRAIEGHSRHDGGDCVGLLVGRDADLPGLLDGPVAPDVRTGADLSHAHCRVGGRDAYLLFNPDDERTRADVTLRARGRPERWDPLTGEMEPIHEYDASAAGLELDLAFEPHGFHLVVVDGRSGVGATGESGAGLERPRVVETSLASVASVDTDGDAVAVRGHARSGGRQSARLVADGDAYAGESDPVAVPSVVDLSSDWTFELEPTLDNEWGDFRYPPGGSIGPEVTALRYRRETPGEDGIEQGWFRERADERAWRAVEPTHGPYFWRRTGVTGEPGTPRDPGDSAAWELYEFSKRTGRPGTHPYLLGYASVVADEFLVSPGNEGDGDGATAFWTTVRSPEAGAAALQYGPGIRRIDVGGQTLAPGRGAGVGGVHSGAETLGPGRAIVHLPEGATPLRVVVEPGVETHAAVEPVAEDARERDLTYVPRVQWFEGADPYALDPFPWEDSVGWYRFEAPAGAVALTVPVRGAARAWVEGVERPVEDGRVALDGPLTEPTTVTVRVDHEPGAYAGAAVTAPLGVETAPVTVETTQWEALGLDSYSGRGRYRRTVTLPDLDDDDRAILELGTVGVTAAVSVNGEHAGTVCSRPFAVDVSGQVRSGENELEVVVANTLANHFAAETPRRYVREDPLTGPGGDLEAVLPNAAEDATASGLLGPVRLRIEPAVTVDARR